MLVQRWDLLSATNIGFDRTICRVGWDQVEQDSPPLTAAGDWRSGHHPKHRDEKVVNPRSSRRNRTLPWFSYKDPSGAVVSQKPSLPPPLLHFHRSPSASGFTRSTSGIRYISRAKSGVLSYSHSGTAASFSPNQQQARKNFSFVIACHVSLYLPVVSQIPQTRNSALLKEEDMEWPGNRALHPFRPNVWRGRV